MRLCACLPLPFPAPHPPQRASLVCLSGAKVFTQCGHGGVVGRRSQGEKHRVMRERQGCLCVCVRVSPFASPPPTPPRNETPNETLLSMDVAWNETLLSIVDLSANETLLSISLCPTETLLSMDLAWNETLLSIVDFAAGGGFSEFPPIGFAAGGDTAMNGFSFERLTAFDNCISKRDASGFGPFPLTPRFGKRKNHHL